MILAVTVLLLASGPAPTDKVTSKNWEHHPKIEAARAVYQEVAALRSKGALKERVRSPADECWDWYLLRIGTDTSSTARYFFRAGGGQDSTHRHAFYYDRAGKLRFALLLGGAANNSTIETR